jgi:hypothetical protein
MPDHDKLTEIAISLMRGDRLFFSKCPLFAVTAYLRHKGCCAYCGRRDLLNSPEGLFAIQELDHLLPFSVYPQLDSDPLNRVPACRYCNQLKRGWDPNDPPVYEKTSTEPLNEQQHLELVGRTQTRVGELRERHRKAFSGARTLWESALARYDTLMLAGHL